MSNTQLTREALEIQAHVKGMKNMFKESDRPSTKGRSLFEQKLFIEQASPNDFEQKRYFALSKGISHSKLFTEQDAHLRWGEGYRQRSWVAFRWPSHSVVQLEEGPAMRRFLSRLPGPEQARCDKGQWYANGH